MVLGIQKHLQNAISKLNAGLLPIILYSSKLCLKNKLVSTSGNLFKEYIRVYNFEKGWNAWIVRYSENFAMQFQNMGNCTKANTAINEHWYSFFTSHSYSCSSFLSRWWSHILLFFFTFLKPFSAYLKRENHKKNYLKYFNLFTINSFTRKSVYVYL